jgi:hypothetical protein
VASPAQSSSLRTLIGSWEFEATREGKPMGRGTTSFEWIEDGAFVLQRADDDPDAEADPGWAANSPMPVTAIIGFDDTTREQVMLYSDARGVFRIYRMSLDDDEWRLWRAAPGFHQRFIGALRDDVQVVGGRWESSPDGSAWEPDFDLTYRKVGSAASAAGADEIRRRGES